MKYWVFDLDDTLVNTHNGLPSALQRTLARFGLAVADSEFDLLRKSNPGDYFTSKVGKSKALEAYHAYLAELETSVSQNSLFEGIDDCLKLLKKKGKSIALWTGRDRNSAEKILNSREILSLFEVHCYGSDSFQQKPNPEGFRFILQSFGAQPNEAVMVGDHEYDLHGPKNLGSITIHAKWGVHNCKLPFMADHSFCEVNSFYQWVDML